MAYNLKRITNVLGAAKLTEALHHAWQNGASKSTLPNLESVGASIVPFLDHFQT